MSESEKKRPRRRFWQYSLRSLGLLLLLCALLLGGWNHYFVPYRKQAAAIGQLNDIGAAIQTAPGGPEWLRQLFGEDQFIDVVRVDLEHQRELKDEDLECLQNLVNLRRLYLAATPVGDEGLRWARHLHGLERLSLWRTNVTDASMEHLARLKNLELIDLHTTTVTNEGIAKLAALPNLKRLRLFPDYYPPSWMPQWHDDFPEIPAAPMRAKTRQILQQAITAATDGKPDLRRENLAVLERLAVLDWPGVEGLPYVKLQLASGAKQTSGGSGWLLDNEGDHYKRLQWNLLPELIHVSNLSGTPDTVQDADFRAELSDWIASEPHHEPPLFLLGLAYAAAEHGMQAETDALIGTLLTQSPVGLPGLADVFVRLRLGLAITSLQARLLRTPGDGGPHWGRFLAQCRGLRDAYPESGYRAQLDSIIEPLSRDLAKGLPPRGDPLAVAVHRLRDRPRPFGAQRRTWEGPMGRLVATGSASIPYLLEALEDRTPTACARGWYPPPAARPGIGITIELPEPNLISRGYLARECLERIVGVNFVSPGSLDNLAPAHREHLLGDIRRWWELSEGKSQADMLRNYLDVFEDRALPGIAAYENNSRFNAWKLICQLEGPQAVEPLIGRYSRDAAFEQNEVLRYGTRDPISRAFERLRAGGLQRDDLDFLITYGKRETYEKLAALAVREGDPDVISWLNPGHLRQAAGTGRNWSAPLLAEALERTEPFDPDSDNPYSLADEAAKQLAAVLGQIEDHDPARKVIDRAVEQAVFRRVSSGLILIDEDDDVATRRDAIRKARAWWLETGRERLAAWVARDHPVRRDVGDLTWSTEKLASVADALTAGDTTVRRRALSGMTQVYTNPIQRALLVALQRETDVELRLQIATIVKNSARIWYLPVLTARLADREEDVRIRLAAADALPNILSRRLRERRMRLETWQAALGALRSVLRDPEQPLELRRRAFDILRRWRDPIDTPLLTGINDGIVAWLRTNR